MLTYNDLKKLFANCEAYRTRQEPKGRLFRLHPDPQKLREHLAKAGGYAAK